MCGGGGGVVVFFFKQKTAYEIRNCDWSSDVCSSDPTRQKINQMSIIFMSEVGGSSSILLVKMVVITSMMVRFTAMASPKRSLSKKMVTKVMRSRRMVGR